MSASESSADLVPTDPALAPELTAHPPTPPAESAPPSAVPGGSRELLALAAPLILSQSFMTVQVFVDTLLLSWHNKDEMTASFPAVMWYWLFFGVLSVTAGYTSTFVAQYTGAGRPHRVGPAVWQGVHFAVVVGLVFLVVVPLAPWLISLGKHPPEIQRLEVIYLQCLSCAALPMLVMGAINGFFSGRGKTWTVLQIEAFGTAVNIVLAFVWVFGEAGITFRDVDGNVTFRIPGVPGAPEGGIAGAGWATVCGSWAAALFALFLFLSPRNRAAFDTLRGWKPERELFGRLMKYGGPAGMQVFLDVLVFHLFTMFVGRLGAAALGATTLTVRLNMIAFLPMMGLGQAVCILVGQRLGENRPDLAERSTYTGLKWSFGYMCLVAAVYLLLPGVLLEMFRGDTGGEKYAAIAAIVPTLLVCVAVYSIADAVNLTFAFALRGAGDTRFVTAVTFALAWPIMVIPTFLVVTYRDYLREHAAWMGEPVYWSWAFATAHIFAMSVCFWLRFRTGKWKSMRVIEAAPAEADPAKV